MDDRDTKGDLYEYMLGKIASAGQNGQFRTPRHIIELMVELTAPTPHDVICDPASGTCGFLVATGEYLREKHPGLFRDPKLNKHFHHSLFHGFDFDNTMLRIGSMNLLLHGVENPDIRYQDSLSNFSVNVVRRGLQQPNARSRLGLWRTAKPRSLDLAFCTYTFGFIRYAIVWGTGFETPTGASEGISCPTASREVQESERVLVGSQGQGQGPNPHGRISFQFFAVMNCERCFSLVVATTTSKDAGPNESAWAARMTSTSRSLASAVGRPC